MRYELKVRCSCGRNLATVTRPAHDDGRNLVGAVEVRQGVRWHEFPAQFTRPGGLAADGWAAECPKCRARHLIPAKAVVEAVKAGDAFLTVGG